MAIVNGTSGNDSLDGTIGQDFFYAGIGNDTLYGGAGNDIMFIQGGDDTFYGGEGRDGIAFFSPTTAPVTVDLRIETTQNIAGILDLTLVSVEGVGSQLGDDYLRGNSEDNNFDGNSGNDTLIGGRGNDTLKGAGGDDFIFGGKGHDLLRPDSGAGAVYGGTGIDTISFSITPDNIGQEVVLSLLDTGIQGGVGRAITVEGVENIVGSSLDDQLTGDHGVNSIDGFLGNDIIKGKRGNDTLLGGKGDDQVFGGRGADYFRDDDGSDTYSGGKGADTFWFRPLFNVTGHDVIKDFAEHNDAEQIDLRNATDIGDFADLLANFMTQDGDDVLITFSEDHDLRLLNVLISDLDANDILV